MTVFNNIHQMRNFYLLPLILVLSICANSVMAQDIHFSQFFEAPLVRNPSLAGIFTGDVRVQAVYRNQWNSVTTPYQTNSLNAEYKMPVGNGENFMTLGMQMLYDKAGDINWQRLHVLPAVNFHKSLSAEKSSYLSIGFMGGLVQNRFDRSKMKTNNQFDGSGWNPGLPDGESFTKNGYSFFDGSVGMTYNTSLGADDENTMFLGVAYHHFNRPKNSFYRNPDVELNRKWVVSGGLKLGVTDYTYFTLQADYSAQGGFRETIGGALYSIKMGDSPDNPAYTIHGGAFLRWKDALIPVVKLDYNPFSFALSYDINLSQLKPASRGRGGFELSLSYIGFMDRDNTSRNKMLCPHF